MSKITKIIFFALASIITIVCSLVLPKYLQEPDYVFSLRSSEITLQEGNNYHINLLSEYSIDLNEYDFSVKDNEIASVDNKGNVTALQTGDTKVTIKYKNANYSKEIKVKVVKEGKKINVKSIKIDKVQKNLSVGEELDLNYTIEPDNATIQDITWISNNPSVISVNKTGRITALKEGTSIIVAKVGNKQGEVKITVGKSTIKPKDKVTITLSNQEISLVPGEKYQLSAKVNPTSTVNKNISWKSSDILIATVNNNGLVVAHKKGEAIISATIGDSISATCIINVVDEKQEDVITITEKKVVYTGSPISADAKSKSNSNITFTYYKESNCKTKIQETAPKNIGVYYVIAKSTGNKTYKGATTKCTKAIEIIKPTITSIKLNTNNMNLVEGQQAKLNVEIIPQAIKDDRITWESSNTDVVVVNNGNITAKASGKATITATSSNGKKDECIIVVTKEIIPITITSKTYKYDGKTHQTSATSSYQITNIKYFSDKQCNILTNTENAEIEGGAPKNAGEYYVIVSINNGKTSPCTKGLIISKIPNTVEINGIKQVSYNGKPVDAETTTNAGKISIKYYTDQECKNETNTPVNAGTYYAIVTSDGDINHYSTSSKCTKAIIINKISDKVTITLNSATYTGNEIAATASATSKSKITVTYYSDSSCKTKTTTTNATAAGGPPKNAGTYYATAKSAGNTNYNSASVGCTKAVVINKATDTVKITTKTATYTGSGIATTASATSKSKITVTYYSDSSCKTKTTTTNATAAGGTPKVVGTYYAIAKSEGNTNYNAGSSTCTKAVIIKKAPVKVTFASFNVGYFNCGASQMSCNPTNTDIINIIKNNGLDVVGTQEARNNGFNTDRIETIGDKSGLKYKYITKPKNINAIISKYELKNKTSTTMTCGETRSLDKTIITINGINISYYNTHLGLNECNEGHWKIMADTIKKDQNPVIITGDFNRVSSDRFNTYLKPLGAIVATYDTTTNNIWGKKSYCDMVVIIPKGHITVVNSKTVNTYGTITDHNMVVATLEIV